MYVQMGVRRGHCSRNCLTPPPQELAVTTHLLLTCHVSFNSIHPTRLLTHSTKVDSHSPVPPFSAASPNLVEEVTEVGSSTVAWERNRAAEGAMIGIIRGAAKMDAVRGRLRSNACGDTGTPGLPHPLTSHQHTHTLCAAYLYLYQPECKEPLHTYKQSFMHSPLTSISV